MSSPHWSVIGEAGAASGLRILFFIYRIFGRAPFRVILFPVILYFFLFRSQSRRASLQYLRRLREFQQLQKTPQRNVLGGNIYFASYRQFFNFGESLLDKLAVWQGDIKMSDVKFHPRPEFDEANNSGRGGVIICSHLGNLDVCRALSLQRPNLKINVLAHTENAQKFNQLLKDAGSDSQINIIHVSGFNPATAMMLSDKIAAGEFIVIAGDRTPIQGTDNICEVDFLNHRAGFPMGPFILAAVLKCQVFTLFCLRGVESDSTRYHLHLKYFSDNVKLPRKNRQQALQQHIQMYADTLAQQCCDTPLQWYNFHHFWLEQQDNS